MKSSQDVFLAHKKCDACSVNSRTICQRAGTETKLELERIGRIRKVAAGQTIAAENESLEFVGNIVSGVVKLSKTLEDGRQQVVGLLFASDFFGHPFTDQTRFSYEAASDVELCVFERKAFEAAASRHPEIEHELLLKLLTELDASREWMVLLGCQNAKERIAGFMLMILRRCLHSGCAKYEMVGHPIIRLPINRKDIALFLGTTLETISRQIQAMSKAKILRIIDGATFEIISPRRLAELASHKEWLDDYPI